MHTRSFRPRRVGKRGGPSFLRDSRAVAVSSRVAWILDLSPVLGITRSHSPPPHFLHAGSACRVRHYYP